MFWGLQGIGKLSCGIHRVTNVVPLGSRLWAQMLYNIPSLFFRACFCCFNLTAAFAGSSEFVHKAVFLLCFGLRVTVAW